MIDSLPQPPLLIISSDMNHYATDAENRELDALALAELERLDPAALFHTCHKHHISMCGMLPAVVVLETLKRLDRLGRAAASAMPPAPMPRATPAASWAMPE